MSTFCMAGLVQLTSLRLEGNHLVTLHSMPLLPALTELFLARNRLTDVSAQLHKAAPLLDVLDLSR
jgi:Leucine-rich repeat (LRR) protein